MKERLNIQVFGKVQGVWYRASTRNKALELGICGTVRNLPDGSVFIEAEGSAEQLQSFLEWCQDGPPHARVDRLEKKTLTLDNYEDFQIIR